MNDHPRAFAVGASLAAVGFGALFPRAMNRMNLPASLSWRDRVVYVVLATLVPFSARQWIVPWWDEVRASNEQALVDLRDELGREPTPDELIAWMRRYHGLD